MNFPPNKAGVMWGLIVLLGGAVFAWDITTPLGQVPWLLYVPIMLLTLWIPHRGAAFIAAGAFSLLIVLDHFLSPSGVGPRISIFNRSLGIPMLWLAAALAETWKRAQDELQQKEYTLRSFYDSASMMMGVADVEGDDIQLVSVNAASARFLSMAPEAIANRRASELGVPREVILEWVRRYHECVRTGRPVRFEYLRQMPAGPRRLSATICYIGGAGEGPARFAYITEDITESRRAEEALRRSEARLHAILDNSPMMIFLKDTEGRYLLSNREFEKITHRPGKDIIGKTDIDLFPREQATAFRANDRRVLEAQTRAEFEEVALHDDGPHTSIVYKFPLFDGNGRVYAIGGIATDITERKRMEQALKNSLDQLHALSARLQSIREEEQTRLAREVHDELGQSLTGLQLGLTWLGEKLDPHQRRVQEKISALLALVGGTIGSVRRISAVLRPVVLDDLGLLAAMEWQTQTFEGQAGIPCTFSSNIEEIELDQMRATAVFRILQESLTNVARHAGATKVTVAFTRMDRLLMLAIQDDGKGIAENVISDHRSLGLIGMQERAHACGGSVTVFRSPGGGTVVTARIPLPRAEQA